jgi:hypothetical protein
MARLLGNIDFSPGFLFTSNCTALIQFKKGSIKYIDIAESHK